MKGFILAAGYGERLRPLTDRTPKPLLPVMNTATICYAVTLLKEAGISDVIINLHYRPDDVISYFHRHENFGIHITFSIEKEMLGTGGGVKKCESLLRDGEFVLVNSDVIMDVRPADVIAAHRASGAPATVVLRATPQADSIGAVGVRDGRVVDFKNFLGSGVMSNYIYTGMAVISPDIFPYLSHEFTSVVYTGYTGLIRDCTLNYYDHRGIWCDTGSPVSYHAANMLVMAHAREFSPRMASACGVKLDAVHADSRIEHGADVRGSIIGAGCVVGRGSVVRNSIMLPGSAVPDNAVVENAIVNGADAIIPA